MSKCMLSGRMAFPHIFAPRKNNDNGDEKYELTLLVKPDAPCVKKYLAECLKVAAEKFGGEAEAKRILMKRPVWKKGDDRDNPPEGYVGMLVITIRSKTMPDFYSADRKRLTLDQAKQIFYAGCMINLISSPWCYDSNGNRGVSHELISIQFAGHADAFSGRPQSSADDFPDLSAQGGDSFSQSDDSNVDDLL